MIYTLIFIISIVLTYFVKVYAIKKSILDLPNERSSHEMPTPRGGGFAVILSFYVGLFYFYMNSLIDQRMFFALLSSLPIVIVGILEDVRGGISRKARLIIQSIAAILAIISLGSVESIDLIFIELRGGWLNIFVFLTILWFTNLYNFLDGIDGYAASEAVLVGLGAFILLDMEIGLLIAFTSLGFLVFNWQKASIFMGDVGSTTLGFLFGVLCFYDTGEGNIYTWLSLLAIFWFDATLTLFRRYRNKEMLVKAHKKHAYQRIVQFGYSHQKTVVISIVINVLAIAILYFLKGIQSLFFLVLYVIILYFITRLIDQRKHFEK